MPATNPEVVVVQTLNHFSSNKAKVVQIISKIREYACVDWPSVVRGGQSMSTTTVGALCNLGGNVISEMFTPMSIQLCKAVISGMLACTRLEFLNIWLPP